MKHMFPLVAAVALAGCGETEPADQASRNADAAEPVPAAPLAGSDPEPLPSPAAENGPPEGTAEGQWYAKTERGVPMALFGPPRTEASFVVRCEGGELVFIRGVPIESDEAEMALAAAGQTRALTARTRPGPLPQTTGRLPANDAFANVLARATGPISITLDEGEPYRIPSSPALRSVVSGCMNG